MGNVGASPLAQTVKNLPAMRETWVPSLRLGRSPGEGNGNQLQHSCLENSMDTRACRVIVHGVTNTQKNYWKNNCGTILKFMFLISTLTVLKWTRPRNLPLTYATRVILLF